MLTFYSNIFKIILNKYNIVIFPIKMSNDLTNLAKMYREQIRHEDTLFNQRITWLMTFQGFLIVPFLLIEKDPNVTKLEYIQTTIVSIGILSAFFVFLGCFAAHQSIKSLISRGLREGISENLLMRNPRYIQVSGAFPSFGSIILISIVWIILLSRISSINQILSFLLLLVALATTFFSLISLLNLLISRPAISTGATPDDDFRIEKIYAGILVTIALYLIMTITYIAIIVLSSSSPQWWSIPIFVLGALFWGVILWLIFSTK